MRPGPLSVELCSVSCSSTRWRTEDGKADRLSGPGGAGHHRPLLHLLHPDRGDAQHPSLLPHVASAFYVGIVIVSNLIGAFASLPASQTDRLGRTNVVIYGLLIVGLLVTFGVPNVTTEWGFAIVISAIGLVEGAILVATPAPGARLQPPVGPGLGHGVLDHRTGGRQPHHQHRRHPHPDPLRRLAEPVHHLRHQRPGHLRPLPGVHEGPVVAFPRPPDGHHPGPVLVEAKSPGLSETDVVAATKRPWSQILRWDLVGSAAGISVFLLIYYAAAGFFTIFYSTTFRNADGSNFSVTQANGLNMWFWGADAIALIVFGVLSDRLRVRKPFMLVGALGAIAMLIVFLMQANHANTGYYTLALIEVFLAMFLSITYAPWMAAYTETVEAKNPALVGTGLALWGWVLRLVVGISFIFLPIVINSVSPVVDNQPLATATIPGTNTNAQQFLLQHPQSVAFATAHAPLLKVLSEPQNVPIVTALAAQPTPANIAAAQKALGTQVFGQLVIYQTQLKTLVLPYATQLAYLSAHQAQLTALQNGVAASPRQWQHWFWVSVGGMVLFIPSIFLIKGRWSPARAKRDQDEHDQRVATELKELVGSNT